MTDYGRSIRSGKRVGNHSKDYYGRDWEDAIVPPMYPIVIGSDYILTSISVSVSTIEYGR